LTSLVFSSRLPAAHPESSVRALFSDSVRANPRVIDLTRTNPTTAGFSYPEAELRRAVGAAGVALYTPEPFGLYSAREALARDWQLRGQSVPPEAIALTASTSEAYALLFKLFCDPGDEVLVPEPSYPLFDLLARLEGVRAVGYRLAYDGAWHVDLDSLRQSRTPRTRAVIAVSPNNPTGSVLKSGEAAACAALGLPLIVDEVFWPYVFQRNAAEPGTALGAEAPLVLVLDGLSKRAGLPQMKLGWVTLAGDAELVRQTRDRLELINDNYLSANTPVQLALPELLQLGLPVQTQIVARTVENLATLNQALAGSAARALTLDGGWCACLRLPDVLSDDEWALSLVSEAEVVVQPGWFYDFPRGSYLVTSLITPPDQFAEGMRRLRQHVDSKL